MRPSIFIVWEVNQKIRGLVFTSFQISLLEKKLCLQQGWATVIQHCINDIHVHRGENHIGAGRLTTETDTQDHFFAVNITVMENSCVWETSCTDSLVRSSNFVCKLEFSLNPDANTWSLYFGHLPFPLKIFLQLLWKQCFVWSNYVLIIL